MSLTLRELGELIEKFAEQVKSKLNQLDAAQGDGDLGATIYNGGIALNETSITCDSIQEWFEVGGKKVRKAAPSTMGILLASALIGVGKRLEKGQTQLNVEDWIIVQETMIQEIQKRGGAQLGDKTILDALIPASEAFSLAIKEGKDLEAALKSAALTAKSSAEATAQLDSKIGRSSWLGERAKGNIDAGAWFCYLSYEFLAKVIKEESVNS
jgi:phosphoenolpyruvate---glycerone phosphotransferase subunit DhaL